VRVGGPGGLTGGWGWGAGERGVAKGSDEGPTGVGASRGDNGGRKEATATKECDAGS